MDHETLRLKAMGIALEEACYTGESLIDRAEEIFKWLRYGKDGATEVRQAMDGIDVVGSITLTNANTGKIQPAKVVGRNESIIDRLRREDGYEKDAG